MSYNDIPKELRDLPQWVCWKYEDIGSSKPTKIPIDAKTGKLASVNDRLTWCSFNHALSVVHNYDGIGFVFTDNDPYAFIDLDEVNDIKLDAVQKSTILERQLKIFREFDSYSERSPSNAGLHIIVKGKVPQGRKRSFIEIYSSGRYATFTGNVYNPNPIQDRTDLLKQLWDQMGSGGPATLLFKGDDQETYDDKTIIQQASDAVNGDKFQQLLSGRWQDIYPSQSEADIAFINIISFYTQNRKQIERIFHASPLGQRDKAKRKDYVLWMINKSFDRMLPDIDLEGFRIALDTKLAASAPPDPDQHSLALIEPDKRVVVPPGLMGEIAQFVYAAAPRPVPEIALAAAIGLMAGICGRAYNVSNTGLNQYILLLAKTGMGKEGMAAGIDKLIHAVKQQVPPIDEFIGPSHIASGQALVKYVHKKSQCFVSILGEFGHRLQNMSDTRTNPHERMLKQILLELYQKSGHTDTYRASIHADFDKNTELTSSPAFSILGESNPYTFYQALNEDMITEGLLPRFLLIEYIGHRPELNEHHAHTYPSNELISKFATLAANCKTLMHNKKVMTVQLSDEANQIARDFDRYATSRINETENEITLHLWNRAHLKALKLSALVAVGINMFNPVIQVEHLNWAINMVQTDIRQLLRKFHTGQVGASSSENKQVEEVTRIFKEYLTQPWDRVASYSPNRILFDNKIISYGYISRRLMTIAAFKLDRMGATNAIKRTLQIMIDSDQIRELPAYDLIQKFGTKQRSFIVSDLSLIR